jgi:nitrogen-specific signal transduction histidine kinase
MAHEFNNPQSIIQGIAKVMQAEMDPADSHYNKVHINVEEASR